MNHRFVFSLLGLVTILLASCMDAKIRRIETWMERSDMDRLFHCLETCEATLQVVVLGALVELNNPAAVDPIIAQIQDPTFVPQDEAMQALVYLNDPKSVDPLIAVLLDTKRERYDRESAAWALGYFKDPKAVEPLITALNSPQEEDPPFDKYGTLRGNAAESLGQIGDDRAAPVLLAHLDDPNSVVFEKSALALAALNHQPAVPVLIDYLTEKAIRPNRILNAEFIARAAAEALGILKNPDAIPPLLQALHHERVMVRGLSAEALGRIGSVDAIPGLIESMKDVEAWVREKSAWALGTIDDPSAVPELLKLMEDPDFTVRCVTAWALGNIGDASAIPTLEAHANDSIPEVREAIRNALAALNPSEG